MAEEVRGGKIFANRSEAANLWIMRDGIGTDISVFIRISIYIYIYMIPSSNKLTAINITELTVEL